MDIVLAAVLQLLLPLADWHHHSSHGGASSEPPDPHIAAFVVGLFFIAAEGLFLAPTCGLGVVLLTRRIRHLFWAVPLTNLVSYVLFCLCYTYPNGRLARLHMPGLVYTTVELVLVLLLGLILAILLALLLLLVRLLRRAYGARRQPAVTSQVTT